MKYKAMVTVTIMDEHSNVVATSSSTAPLIGDVAKYPPFTLAHVLQDTAEDAVKVRYESMRAKTPQ